MIDKERILALTDGGLRVFCHYLGFEVNLHRNFCSPFYDDKRASCHISTMTRNPQLISTTTMAIPPMRGIASGSWLSYEV